MKKFSFLLSLLAIFAFAAPVAANETTTDAAHTDHASDAAHTDGEHHPDEDESTKDQTHHEEKK